MTRRSTSLLVLGALLAASLLLTPDVLLIVFAGVLLAVLLHGGGHAIAMKLGIADGWGIALFLLGIVIALAGFQYDRRTGDRGTDR
jgi:membrane protein implicated in regulation of membrane protease activity